MNRTSQTNEWRLKPLVDHFNRPETQESWNDLSTIDPLGLYSKIPTMACTPAIMEIPELKGKLKFDGNIVNKNQSVNVFKLAVEPVWNIAKLAERLKLSEDELRTCMYKWTSNHEILDKRNEIYLPPIGNTSI